MEKGEPLMEEIIKKQLEKWEKRRAKESGGLPHVPAITLSVEPGSGGTLIAKGISERLDFDLFDRAIIEAVAESTEKSAQVIEALEKERLSGIEDFIASFVRNEYLYPGTYLNHLMRIVSSVGTYGKAVIVGRGANFILPPESRFSIRVIAPREIRIQNVVKRFKVSEDEAKKRVFQREAKRSAFIKQSFHKDVSNPVHYDLVVNTGKTDTEPAIEGVCAYFCALHPEAKSL